MQAEACAHTSRQLRSRCFARAGSCEGGLHTAWAFGPVGQRGRAPAHTRRAVARYPLHARVRHVNVGLLGRSTHSKEQCQGLPLGLSSWLSVCSDRQAADGRAAGLIRNHVCADQCDIAPVETALSRVEASSLQRVFQVNAFGPILVSKVPNVSHGP
jgi:hypothetical protein